MIIDYTYFRGKLNLPQTGNTDGRSLVTQFILNYEDEYLKRVLGYDLWKVFMEGIEGSGQPDQRWVDLLEGAEFIYNSKNYKWGGFAAGQDAIDVNPSNQVTLVVDGSGPYDPPAGNSFELPPSFVGTLFIIERRGTGQLRADEYSVNGSTVTLNPLQTGETLFLTKGALTGSPLSNGQDKFSPITNYVYYKFMEDKATDNTLVGTAVQNVDNNSRVNAVSKMISAWNTMVDQNKLLWMFLKANSDTYPEWQQVNWAYNWWDWSWWADENNCWMLSELYRKKNSFDI